MGWIEIYVLDWIYLGDPSQWIGHTLDSVALCSTSRYHWLLYIVCLITWEKHCLIPRYSIYSNTEVNKKIMFKCKLTKYVNVNLFRWTTSIMSDEANPLSPSERAALDPLMADEEARFQADIDKAIQLSLKSQAEDDQRRRHSGRHHQQQLQPQKTVSCSAQRARRNTINVTAAGAGAAGASAALGNPRRSLGNLHAGRPAQGELMHLAVHGNVLFLRFSFRSQVLVLINF